MLPELVTTGADGFKAVNYSLLPLLAIQAIRELKDRNDGLEASVAELRRGWRRSKPRTADAPSGRPGVRPVSPVVVTLVHGTILLARWPWLSRTGRRLGALWPSRGRDTSRDADNRLDGRRR